MKAKSKLINQCVSKAKKYLAIIRGMKRKIGVYEADISELALKVCEIRHGGISTNIYTIKDFSEDIGMNHKTLQNWVSAYRTVVPIIGRNKINNQKDWSDVRKTKRIVGDSAPARQVRDLFDAFNDDEIKEKPFVAEFRNSVACIKHLKYMIGKRDLSMVDFGKWIELMSELDDCSDMINDYLTKNKENLAASIIG